MSPPRAPGPGKPVFLGPRLQECGADGRVKSRTGTVFLRTPGLVTVKKLHVLQQIAWIEHLNKRRAKAGLPALSEKEEEAESGQSVDLLMDDQFVYIRPNPERMDLAERADAFIQERCGVPKVLIRYLKITDPDVSKNLRERGELWRMTPEPITDREMEAFIENSRLAMGGRAIYRYNKNTGTRHITPAAFCSLGDLPEAGLRAHLVEIQNLLRGRNRAGRPEAAFFPLGCAFTLPDADYAALPEIHAEHQRLAAAFLRATDPALHADNPPDDPAWSQALCRALSAEVNEFLANGEEIFKELPREFFRKIRWLPGADFERNEVRFDPIYSDPKPLVPGLRDFQARAIIHNCASELRGISHINIGRVEASLSIKRPRLDHDNTVYIAEVKCRGDSGLHTLRHLRFNKSNVAEILDNAPSLSFEKAVFKSEEYTEFILDRRLGCIQFGMNLPEDMVVHRVRKIYNGKAARYKNRAYWNTYTVRAFVPGFATDKIPEPLYKNPAFTQKFAELLGGAAAVNIVIGRSDPKAETPYFDDGDEILQLDADGLPKTITVADPTGAFAHFKPSLCGIAPEYAKPVNSRRGLPVDLRAFADAYLRHFALRLAELRDNYLAAQTAYDTLFNHLPVNTGGHIRQRWEAILLRLRNANIERLVNLVQNAVKT